MNRTAAVTFIALLVLLGLPVLPAYGSPDITVETDKTVYNPGDTIVVTGTTVPNDVVSITLLREGETVTFRQANADENGNYRAEIPLPTEEQLQDPLYQARYPFGDYTISVVSALTGDSASTTLSFQEAVPPPPPVEEVVGLAVQVEVGGSHLVGEPVTIYIVVTEAGALVDSETFQFLVIHVKPPVGELVNLAPASPKDIEIHQGFYAVSYTETDQAGIYGVHVAVKKGDATAHALASFTVTDQLATAGQVSALSDQLAAVSESLSGEVAAVADSVKTLGDQLSGAITRSESSIKATISSSADDVKSAVANSQAAIEAAIGNSQAAITGAISAAQSAVTQAVSNSETSIKAAIDTANADVKTAVSNAATDVKGAVSSAQNALSGKIDGLAGSVSDAKSSADAAKSTVEQIGAGLGQVSTFVVVVAVLAVITIVLELVILLRRGGGP
jgi:hypothetical protein